ncbi:peptidyl-tRNA hydrolase, PTH2 family [Nematocida sp. AWRm80]|nr:peptidyl-tRNA hydrolase, PTH2 family [Nematocida sp. AWRm80]
MFFWLLVVIVVLLLFYLRKKEVIRTEPVKAVLLVRNDLKMNKGKIVAQGMHAAYSMGRNRKSIGMIKIWRIFGFKKVALKVEGEEEMKRLYMEFRRNNIPVYKVIDAGRTQVEPGTWTVTLAGPYYESDIDRISGHLKLL